MLRTYLGTIFFSNYNITYLFFVSFDINFKVLMIWALKRIIDILNLQKYCVLRIFVNCLFIYLFIMCKL